MKVNASDILFLRCFFMSISGNKQIAKALFQKQYPELIQPRRSKKNEYR